MTEGGDDPSRPSRGLVEEAELPQHRATVIVDALARQAVTGVERVDPAKREFQPSARRWQAAPRSKMRTPDGDLHHQAFGCHVPVLHLNCQIGQRAHDLCVIRSHAFAASAVIPQGSSSYRASTPNVAITASRSCRFSHRMCSSTTAMRACTRSASSSDMPYLLATHSSPTPAPPYLRSSAIPFQHGPPALNVYLSRRGGHRR